MRKHKLTLLSLVGLCAGPAVIANDIEPTKEFYTAVRAPAPIVLDGNLAEWSGAPILADPKFSIPKGSGDSGTLVLFEEYNGGTWSGPSDQTSAVQVVYDDNNIYFGFVVTDDYHENAANSAWNGDSVQLMVANGDRSQQVGLYNYALGGIEGELGEVIVMHEAGPGETEAVVTRDAATKKTTYEIKLPATALGLTAPLTAGTKFGLGMAINDGDNGENQAGQKGWGGLGAHSIVFGKTPSETASVTLGASETTVEILGVGAESLIGGDLTDPENDGDETAGATSPTWNWRSIRSSHEPGFGGGEFAFNIFDNLVGGGSDKWCCDDPTLANPVWVSVEFPNPVSLTHFTVSSGNDSPDRDPTNWAIQGSNDGATYTDIYRGPSTPPWTERNQVVKFTLPVASPSYRHIRYIAFETPGTLHQINEVEFFGTFGGADRFFLSAINPTIEGFSFRATDVAASVVDPASARVTIDGQTIAVTPTRTGDSVDFVYRAPSPFLPLSEHTYTIEVKDTLGNTVTSSGPFRIQAYALLSAPLKVAADTTKRGFMWRVHQNNAFQANNNTRPVQQLAGLLGENFADPAAQGVAIAPGTPGATPNLPVTFEIETVINMDQSAADNGEFNPNDQMPGIPGTSGDGLNGIAGEILTYVDLPVGRHTFIVNSDDGFRTTAGNLDDIFEAQVAGQFEGGRGAADTAYTIYVQDAGIYALKTVWQEGGGGANIEWKTEKPDLTRVLLNDTANGGFTTYRSSPTPVPTAVTSVTPARNANKVVGNTAIEAVIREGATTVDTASIRFRVNGTEVTPTTTRSGANITARYTPTAAFAANSTNTVALTFSHGTATRSNSWSFVVPRSTLDEIAQRPALILNTAKYTASGAGRTGQAGDFAMDFGLGVGQPSVLIPDASFVNATTADDVMTFSIWVKKYDNANSSAFWADSPSSPSGQRGFQAHTPWSDQTVYFDTAGCCNAEETRINLPIDQFPGFTGDIAAGDISWWTNAWHHFVFVKNVGTKEIYIDGQLFHSGGGTTPLPTDFARIWLGAEGGGPDSGVANNIHGQLDDFAVFGTALSAADVGRLFSGTLPSALGAATKPLAHWDFNDGTVVVDRPTITVARAANGTVTLSWPASATGFTLRSAAVVNGPYTAVPNVTGNSYVVPAPASGKVFYQLQQ